MTAAYAVDQQCSPLLPSLQRRRPSRGNLSSAGTRVVLNMVMMQDIGVVALAMTITSLAVALVVAKYLIIRRKQPKYPPALVGWPVIGNLLQLKEKKPYLTFAAWAEDYGPIFSIKLGATSMVVLNTTKLAKEALITKFSSISTRKLSNAVMTLTCNKAIVAMSDYGDYHKTVKRYILSGLLGQNAQKRNRHHRDAMIENVVAALFSKIVDNDFSLVEFRELFQSELFQLALKQSLGKDVENVYVEELGVTVTKQDMLQILVLDPMAGALEFDWRDFFPYLRWIPNKRFEMKIQHMAIRKMAVTKALIEEQKQRIARGEDINCYLDYLLQSQETALTEEQLITLVWESIIESSDTTLAITEWILFELSKNQACQDCLYQEIQKVCGSKKVTEDHIQYLPYLNAVFHETLRFRSPVPILPPRHVHESTQLGGYDIPAGTDIIINIYACNMDKKDWEEPNVWKPERFLSDKYEQMDMYKTMAFGGGKRACAGSLQVLLISCTSIARLIQEFHWKLKDGEEENINTVQLITHKLYPMQAYIRPRAAVGSMQAS